MYSTHTNLYVQKYVVSGITREISRWNKKYKALKSKGVEVNFLIGFLPSVGEIQQSCEVSEGFKCHNAYKPSSIGILFRRGLNFSISLSLFFSPSLEAPEASFLSYFKGELLKIIITSARSNSPKDPPQCSPAAFACSGVGVASSESR